MDSIILTLPDDWHLHLRDGEALKSVLPHTARQFGRAIVMPNLKPPITRMAMAMEYRQRILAALPADSSFEPLMTLYLTDHTPVDEVMQAKASGLVHGVKLYPAGATTHSDAGVTDLRRCQAVLEAMQELGLPFLIHGEVTDPTVDIFEREARFIVEVLAPLQTRLPKLRIVLEHITTREAVEFVNSTPANVGATITPQHLWYNRNALFQGGIRPHHYCLPVLKKEPHRLAVLQAAISGNPKFFLGTDSAPHARHTKETTCGCAGMYTAHAALELYATVFEQAGALDKLEAFASFHGADFYGLARNRRQIRLIRETWTVPASYPFATGAEVVPMCAGETLHWRLA
jgi:dihydroorotase